MRVVEKFKPLLEKVEDELAKLEINYDERLEALEYILNLAENIGLAYKEADINVKKQYLKLFIKKLWVREGKIVKYDLAPDVEGLIQSGSVRVRTTGLPREDSNLQPTG